MSASASIDFILAADLFIQGRNLEGVLSLAPGAAGEFASLAGRTAKESRQRSVSAAIVTQQILPEVNGSEPQPESAQIRTLDHNHNNCLRSEKTHKC